MFDLISMKDATENYHYRELIGEPLRLELNFIIRLEHVKELIVLGERMCLVAVDKVGVVGKTSKTLFLSSKWAIVFDYSPVGTVVLFPLIMLQLLIMTILPLWKRNQPAFNDCKLSSNIVLCRRSWSSEALSPQVQTWTDDVRTTTVQSQRLRFVHVTCSFSSRKLPRRKNYRSSWCSCTFFHK